MKKGQIYEGIIERVDFPNKGMILYSGGRKICHGEKWYPGSESPLYDQ